MGFTRFAVYYVPPRDSDLARFGAAWLGWDIDGAEPVDQPDIPGLEPITRQPRRYGFHGTLRAPFRLAEGVSAAAVAAKLDELTEVCAPAQGGGLELARIGGFLALVPVSGGSGPDGIGRIAAACLRATDPLRAPPGAQELARRRRARLSPRQEALLQRWGYPYVLDQFRFHLTLTGPLPEAGIGLWRQRLAERLPVLPVPFRLHSIALVGERPDGRFETIRRFALRG